jgi:hypothetical protein
LPEFPVIEGEYLRDILFGYVLSVGSRAKPAITNAS